MRRDSIILIRHGAPVCSMLPAGRAPRRYEPMLAGIEPPSIDTDTDTVGRHGACRPGNRRRHLQEAVVAIRQRHIDLHRIVTKLPSALDRTVGGLPAGARPTEASIGSRVEMHRFESGF